MKCKVVYLPKDLLAGISRIDNPLFCHCTRGYTKERFETLFDRPVRVELLECIIRGDGRCRQAITIIDADE